MSAVSHVFCLPWVGRVAVGVRGPKVGSGGSRRRTTPQGSLAPGTRQGMGEGPGFRGGTGRDRPFGRDALTVSTCGKSLASGREDYQTGSVSRLFRISITEKSFL